MPMIHPSLNRIIYMISALQGLHHEIYIGIPGGGKAAWGKEWQTFRPAREAIPEVFDLHQEETQTNGLNLFAS